MAAPSVSKTLEAHFPLVQHQGLNTNKAVNFSDFQVDTSGNVSMPGTLAVTGVATFTATPVFNGGMARTITNVTGATLAPAASASGVLYTLNKADGIAVTLPALVGTAPIGTNYEFVFATSAAGGNSTITAAAGDLLTGGVTAVDTDSSNAVVFDDADATDDLIMTFNGTTLGGLKGTYIKVVALTATNWQVSGFNLHSGNFATIFS